MVLQKKNGQATEWSRRSEAILTGRHEESFQDDEVISSFLLSYRLPRPAEAGLAMTMKINLSAL
jgi:hypothetical protein